MDACFQQFFYADGAHNFPLVITPDFAGASRGTRDYGLMLLWPACVHTNTSWRPFIPAAGNLRRQRADTLSKNRRL